MEHYNKRMWYNSSKSKDRLEELILKECKGKLKCTVKLDKEFNSLLSQVDNEVRRNLIIFAQVYC